MATIHNTGRTHIGLPNGVMVPAGGSAEVSEADWKKYSERKVIAYYVEEGILSTKAPGGRKAAQQEAAVEEKKAEGEKPAEPARTGAPGAPPAAPARR